MKSNIQKIRFWEPTLSPHKHYLFEKICELRPDLEFECYAASDLAADRKSLGWTLVNNTKYKIFINPDEEEIKKKLLQTDNLTLDVFSGIRWVPMLSSAFSYAIKSHGLIAIMSEPRVYTGFFGWMRIIHSLVTERRYLSRVNYIFAIGAHGPTWFKTIGYPENIVHNFAYYIPKKLINNAAVHFKNEKKIKIIYVGRLVYMKGVDILIKSINAAKLNEVVSVTVVGVGEKKESLIQLSKDLKVDANFLGVVDNSSVQSIISEHDVLILPSRTMDDGWGVVVSEALLCGIPVIVSDAVGASIAVRNSDYGYVFKNKSIEDLKEKLCIFVNNIVYYRKNKEKLAQISFTEFSDDAGAKIFLNAINCKY